MTSVTAQRTSLGFAEAWLQSVSAESMPDESSRQRARGRESDLMPEGSKADVYRALFDAYVPRVRRHLECYIDNAHDVDEVLADVFTVAWRKLSPSVPLPFVWFLRTADNKLRDRGRTARSRERALEALARGATDNQRLHPLEAIAVRRALKDLNARERQVVVLTYWDELSAGEVAEVLHCSQAAVWTTLSRARAKLRSQLQLSGGDE